MLSALSNIPAISELNQIIGVNDGYITLAGTTEIFSEAIPIIADGKSKIQIQITVNFDATPTDNVQINIYSSLDGSTIDATAISSFIIDNAIDPNIISFTLTDLFYVMIGAQQTGATNSHDIRAYERRA